VVLLRPHPPPPLTLTLLPQRVLRPIAQGARARTDGPCVVRTTEVDAALRTMFVEVAVLLQSVVFRTRRSSSRVVLEP
jgi:hypothetical protein